MKQRCFCTLREKLIGQLRELSDEKRDDVLNATRDLGYDISQITSEGNGVDLCCTLLFIFYLCFCCKDYEGLITQIRRIIIDFQKNEQPS